MTVLTEQIRAMAKRKSKRKGQLLSIVDRLPGGLPIVTCTPPRSPQGDGKHRCGRALARGEAFLEWQPGGEDRSIAGCVFHLGTTDPDFTVEDYEYLLAHANYGLIAAGGDRIMYLLSIPIRDRARVHKVLSTCYRLMLRRQQDALDQAQVAQPHCSRNWEAFRQLCAARAAREQQQQQP